MSASGLPTTENDRAIAQNRFFLGDFVVHRGSTQRMQVKGFYGDMIWCHWIETTRNQSRLCNPADLNLASPLDPAGAGHAIEPGMIVRHGSGGPALTVTEVDHDVAWCEWSVGKRMQLRQFPIVELYEVKS